MRRSLGCSRRAIRQAQIEGARRDTDRLDPGRSDKALVGQLQTLVTQKSDAVIQTLGTLAVIDPWLKKLRRAGVPVL